MRVKYGLGCMDDSVKWWGAYIEQDFMYTVCCIHSVVCILRSSIYYLYTT